MKFLPRIKRHMSSVPQKFNFIWSPRSTVMKMTNTTSIENLAAKTYFYREFHKDSKKSAFAILRFFYDLLWISKVPTK
jgi:hypothetical protein